jgi:hypothetical protein
LNYFKLEHDATEFAFQTDHYGDDGLERGCLGSRESEEDQNCCHISGKVQEVLLGGRDENYNQIGLGLKAERKMFWS